MISIVVPIYNVEEYLEDCLSSIENQTYKDYEVIMINDGSTDNSKEIAEKYQEKDNRFILINQENKGLSGARNTAIKYMKGEYVSFLDSDDKFAPTFLEKCMEYIEKEDADIVETGRYYITADSFGENNVYIDEKNVSDEIEVITSKKELFKKLGNGHVYNSVFPRVLKSELITNNFFPEGLIFEDLATSPMLLDKVNKFVKINKGLFLYRVRENSITTNKFSEKSLDIFTVCDFVEKYFLDNYNEDIMADIYLLLFRNISFQYKLYMTRNHQYRSKYEEYLKKYASHLTGYNEGVLKLYRRSPKYFYYILKVSQLKKKIIKRVKG